MEGWFGHGISFQLLINRPPAELSRVLREERVGFYREQVHADRFPMLGNVEIRLSDIRNGRKSPHTYLKPTGDALLP